MPKYTVKLTKPAVKYYEKLPPKLKNKVKEVINLLRENPYAIPNAKPLEGSNQDDFHNHLMKHSVKQDFPGRPCDKSRVSFIV